VRSRGGGSGGSEACALKTAAAASVSAGVGDEVPVLEPDWPPLPANCASSAIAAATPRSASTLLALAEMTAAAAAGAAMDSATRLICERYLLAGVSLHAASYASLVRKSLPAFARVDQRVGAAAAGAAPPPTSIGTMSAAQRREEGRGEAEK